MKNNVTIKDVAKLAGVSISTVSRVINDSKPVTDEVKQRVLDVIKETGYVPNPLARSLVTKKSKLIGVIVPEVSDSFVNEILNGIEAVSKMYDYDILLVNTYSDKEQELESIKLLKTKQVEGIVMLSWILDEDHVNAMKESRIPAVYISKTARNYDIYTVSTSNEDATYDMTEYLIKNGHEDIAFIMTSKEETILERERRTGYERALKDNNISYGFQDGQLAAPQANAMAAVIEPLMNGSGAPWMLYGIGAVIALLLNAFGVSALAFALGMFIPLELNLPLLAGGAIQWFVSTRSQDATVNNARSERGTLLSSGFIAGGALMGVVSAALRFGGVEFDYSIWWANTLSELLSLGMYCMLCIFLIKMSMRSKA